MTHFNQGTKDIETHGYQPTAKEIAVRNCLTRAETIMEEMLNKLAGYLDPTDYRTMCISVGIWKEEKENL